MMSSELKGQVEKVRENQCLHEMEVVVGDENLEFDLHRHLVQCSKNPDHPQFIPVHKLDLNHLPDNCRNPSLLALIKERCTETMKLMVRYTSPSRPDDDNYSPLKGTTAMRIGSGFFSRSISESLAGNIGENQPCPFPNCSIKPGVHMVSPFFNIFTAAHVVFDDSEAQAASLEFFYDNESDKSKVVKAQGIRVHHIDTNGDICFMTCVTHDLDMLDKMHKLEKEADLMSDDIVGNMPPASLAFVISHPHGCSKQVTFGKLVSKAILKEFDAGFVKRVNEGRIQSNRPKVKRAAWCSFQYNIPTCPGSSGAPVHVIEIADGRTQQCFAPHSCHSQTTKTNNSGLGAMWENSFDSY